MKSHDGQPAQSHGLFSTWRPRAISAARRAPLIGLLAAIVIVVLAHFHLAYIAIKSQPECAIHSTLPDEKSEVYRAAKSSC